MESKSKTKGSSGQLTRKERKLLAIARQLEKETECLRHGLPEWYYRHGYVSISEAAKRLGCRPVDVLKGRFYVLLRRGKFVPISEIRGRMEAKAQTNLRALVLEMWRVVKPQWLPDEFTPSFGSSLFPPHRVVQRFRVEEIAKRLHVTPRRVRELIRDDGPTSLAAHRPGGHMEVTLYELEAFEKAYGKEISAALRAA